MAYEDLDHNRVDLDDMAWTPTSERTLAFEPSNDGDSPHHLRKTSSYSQSPSFNELLREVVTATEPGLRHLASDSDMNSIRSYAQSTGPHRTSLSSQRHPGKPGARISRMTRNLDDMVDWDEVPPAMPPSVTENEKETDDGAGGGVDPTLTHEYPGPVALFLLVFGICISVFLISLDRTIITTAIPYITTDFQSYDDVGWYGSSYLLTASAFQPMYGRIFSSFNIKWSYLSALILFEVGSLLCGICPNSNVLIIGRAVAGVGSAGLLTGSFVVVAHAVPLAKRPVYTSCIGMMFGIGAIIGPLLGGVFTDRLTWRWCFYINLPVGGATFITMLLFFRPIGDATKGRSFLKRVFELDLVGNVILLAASIMFFLALQFTEQREPWTSPRVIGLLVGCVLTSVVWIIWLRYRGEAALIPLRIMHQRTVAASCLMAFFIYGALLIHTYYLPIWFQAIRNDSAILSGVHMIPYMVTNSFTSLLSGILVSKTGYFTPPAIIGTAIATAGCGLISTLGLTTPTANWVGYQIVAGFGFGVAIQQGFIAVQTVLPFKDTSVGTAAVVACQSLGGAVFISVGNTILQGRLYATHLPGVNIPTIIDDGASDFRKDVPPAELNALLNVYSDAMDKVFLAAVPLAGCAFLASLLMEWKSVKGPRQNIVKESSSEGTASPDVEEGSHKSRTSGVPSSKI